MAVGGVNSSSDWVPVVKTMSEIVGILGCVTMIGGGITAIVGHARDLPKVVNIGRWVALGGGIPWLVGSMTYGVLDSKGY